MSHERSPNLPDHLVTKEALDHMNVEELFRCAEAKKLPRKVLLSSPTSRAIMRVEIQLSPSSSAVRNEGDIYERVVDARDPIWEKFGGFPEALKKGDDAPVKAIDLPLIAEWDARCERVQDEGYFLVADRIRKERKERAYQLCFDLFDAIKEWQESLPLRQGFFLQSCEGIKLKALLTWDNSRVLRDGDMGLDMQQRLRYLAEYLAKVPFQRGATVLLGSAVQKQLSDYKDLVEEMLRSLTAVSGTFSHGGRPQADHFYNNRFAHNDDHWCFILSSVANGADPRSLYQWFDKSPLEYSASPEDEKMDDLARRILPLSGKPKPKPPAGHPYR